MKLKEINIKNFMSFDELEFEFLPGMTLITGLNKESDRSNGSGKSSIFLAVFWALYGTIPRAVSSTEVVRYGEKMCSVTLKFTHNNKEFIVTRNRGGKQKFVGIVDGEPLEESELQTLIPSIEKFSIAMHSQNSLRFLQLTDSQKKEILMSLVEFSPEKALEKMKADMKGIQKKIVEIETGIQYKTNELQTLKSKSFNFTSKEQEEIQEGTEIQRVTKLREQYVKLKASAVQPDPAIQSKIDKLQKDVAAIQDEQQIRQIISRSEEATKKILEIMDKPLGKSLECPHCRTLFIPEREVLEAIRDKQLEMQRSLIVSDDKIQEMKNNLNVAKKIQQEISELRELQRKFQVSISSISDQLEAIASEGGKLKEQIKQFLSVQSDIKTITKAIDSLNQEKTKIEAHQEILQYAIDTLSPSGVASYITELVLNQINDYLYEHTNTLFPNISFEFTSQSELKSGKFSTKLGEILVVEGRPASLGSLSGGEFRALSLAVDLAIMRTMESFSGISFETLLFDEPFDGLDGVGRVTATKLLQSLSESRSVVMIEHAAEVGSFNNHLFLVTKEGAVSSGRYF